MPNTENIKKPKAEGDKRRRGKKNVNWKNDPEILTRLSKVSELMVQHMSALLIAQATSVSLGTAKRDIKRTRELWKEEAQDRILNSRDLAIAQYGAQIKNAWEKQKDLPATHPNLPAFMNAALRAQERIDKVTGIVDVGRVEHSGPEGGPIPVEVMNMEAIRKKRWKQITSNLGELAAKENNATSKPTPKKP